MAITNSLTRPRPSEKSIVAKSNDNLSEQASQRFVSLPFLTWERDGGAADESRHLGAVPMAGHFTLNLGAGDDVAQGVVFDRLGSPMAGLLRAQCKHGVLYVTDQSDNEFGQTSGLMAGNYHVLDYPLFHMDIRENVKDRVTSYFASRSGRVSAIEDVVTDASRTP